MAITSRKPADDRKQQIISSTRDLIMEYGHKSVRMDDIAVSVGISKAAIFHHFENKSALMKEVVQTVVQEPLKAAETSIEPNAKLETNLVNLLVAAYSCTKYKSTRFMALVDNYADICQQIIGRDTHELMKLIDKMLIKAIEEKRIDLNKVNLTSIQFAELLLLASHGVAHPVNGVILAPAALKKTICSLVHTLLTGIGNGPSPTSSILS